MSGDDYTRANFGALTAGEANFSMAARALRDELTDLEGKLKGNLSRWEGGAQEFYWQAKAKWDKSAADMQNIVQQLGVAIGDSSANYQAAEKANTGIWGG
ncbi:WXG100 family type VII secretion target [Actinomadura alba]|uniref:WXG100 family type VII secretion target n=1 Tax=Actinomadura alba TaxID=406431 RepID=A0ABR7LNI9_9ACTN|nr:WXG100 family type VII secretion target [Actinomadura alba]MBC6466344.1 WXG100 family type VII secretion target [Actinomadura alba]